MIKVFIFTLAVCSMSYQQCRVIEEATIYFDNYRDCALHGYEYSYKLLEAFDPEIHEAVTQFDAPTEDMKGKVIDELEKGYFLNDKVIRFAKLVVGK